MSKIPLSVVLPIYNGENEIERCLSDILKQTFTNFELIIIDDGSTDSTPEKLKRIKDKRIKIIRNEINKGVTYSLNRALKKCRGEFIARCDVDDRNRKDRFEKQITFLQKNSNYVLVGSNAKWCNESGKRIKGFSVSIQDRDIRKWMYVRNQFFHPSVMFRKSIIEKTGGYRNVLNGVEDYDLWFRMLTQGKVYNIPEPLITRTISASAVTAKNHLKIECMGVLVRFIHLPKLLKLL